MDEQITERAAAPKNNTELIGGGLVRVQGALDQIAALVKFQLGDEPKSDRGYAAYHERKRRIKPFAQEATRLLEALRTMLVEAWLADEVINPNALIDEVVEWAKTNIINAANPRPTAGGEG